MKLIFPQNVFSKLIADNIPDELSPEFSFFPSAQLSAELLKNPDSAALIPAMDLINHKDLFISRKFGLSFEGALCNSYIYYNAKQQRELNDVYLTGDVSSQEVLLCKILFKELYDSAVNIHLMTDNNFSNKNFILAGDQNFTGDIFVNGVSLAEEMIENLNLPYVNYVFAAVNEESLKKIQPFFENIGEAVINSVENGQFGETFSDTAKEYFKNNFSSVITSFDEQDVEGLEQLLRLPYFHGLINDIIEVKYV